MQIDKFFYKVFKTEKKKLPIKASEGFKTRIVGTVQPLLIWCVDSNLEIERNYEIRARFRRQRVKERAQNGPY
jgi:hypothetical protein